MVLFYISLLIIGSSHLFAHAMHGGVKPYPIEKVPYVAQIYDTFERGLHSFCGGAILSERWILTAAHCILTGDKTFLYRQVIVGTSKTMLGDKRHNISRIINNSHYSLKTRWNSDLSLIELAEPIEFDDKSQPISISKNTPKAGNEITLAGYGDDVRTPVWDLQMGRQLVITQRECRRAYKKTPQAKFMLDNRTFCTNSTAVDAGGGDSGSPAVLNGKVVGVAVEANETPLPNVYVNVAHYYAWIAKTTGIKFD